MHLTYLGCDLTIVIKFKAYFDVPICLNNDANAAISEMMFEGAQNMKYFIMILSAGIGSCIILVVFDVG